MSFGREIIELLSKRGLDTKEAEALLRHFKNSLALHIAERGRLLKALGRLT